MNRQYEGTFCNIPVLVNVNCNNNICIDSKSKLLHVPLKICKVLDYLIVHCKIGEGFVLHTTKIEPKVVERNAYDDEAHHYENDGFEAGSLYYDSDSNEVINIVGEGVAGMPEVITHLDSTYYANPISLKPLRCTQCNSSNNIIAHEENDVVQYYCTTCNNTIVLII